MARMAATEDHGLASTKSREGMADGSFILAQPDGGYSCNERRCILMESNQCVMDGCDDTSVSRWTGLVGTCSPVLHVT
jgi:hypothetical protein